MKIVYLILVLCVGLQLIILVHLHQKPREIVTNFYYLTQPEDLTKIPDFEDPGIPYKHSMKYQSKD